MRYVLGNGMTLLLQNVIFVLEDLSLNWWEIDLKYNGLDMHLREKIFQSLSLLFSELTDRSNFSQFSISNEINAKSKCARLNGVHTAASSW